MNNLQPQIRPAQWGHWQDTIIIKANTPPSHNHHFTNPPVEMPLPLCLHKYNCALVFGALSRAGMAVFLYLIKVQCVSACVYHQPPHCPPTYRLAQLKSAGPFKTKSCWAEATLLSHIFCLFFFLQLYLTISLPLSTLITFLFPIPFSSPWCVRTCLLRVGKGKGEMME